MSAIPAPTPPPGTPAPAVPANAPAAPPGAASTLSPEIQERFALYEKRLAEAEARLKSETSVERGKREKAEADAAAAIAKVKTGDERIAALEESFRAAQKGRAISEAARGHTFVSADAQRDALDLFAMRNKIEVRDTGEVMATGADGAAKPIEDAFKAWIEKDGGRFRAAAAQPGAGTLPGATPGGQTADIASMPRAEFDKLVAQGVTGKLTHDPKAPEIVIRKSENRFSKGREEWLAKAWGNQMNAGMGGGLQPGR